jgi:transcriptional regulator with XRE-family HTH domain
MIKFAATNKWYELAAQSETNILDVSAGSSTLSVTGAAEPIPVTNIKQIRKLEGFSTLLRMLRLNKGFSIEKLASKINVEIKELVLLERQAGYKANPRTLVALANFYNIPIKRFLQISGAIKATDAEMEDEVIRFAAESELLEKLTAQEKSLLSRTMGIISKAKW